MEAKNLPVPPTPLIGREQELVLAADLLRRVDTRLLTLYGTGGVGKTRLALAVAEALVGSFSDGIFFVPLADIADGGLLLSTISQALELYTLPDETILPTLAGHMRDMDALLVLDNFEQLLSAAPLLAELLSRCPRLKLLITSRFVLHLRSEQELAVQPLPVSLAKDERGTGLNGIESGPAVRLFLERARSVQRDFKLDSENAGTIAEICSRLDGLPLAIELAAARVKLLSPKAMLSRLEKRLQLLTGGAQDLPARQQTLRNTINWSYELLTPSEQRLFRLLSIFSGGCTLEALQIVCEAVENRGWELSIGSSESLIRNPQSPFPIDILDLATSLANKSLLRVVENNGAEPRLLMLETVREYAGERLREIGEHAPARTAHANYVLALAEEAEPYLRGPEQVRWLDSLEREMGNVRVALEWCAGSAGTEGDGGEISMERLETGLRIAGSLARFWQARSHLHEAGVWLHTLLSRTTTLRTEARERALRTAGRLTSNLRDREQSRIYYEEALSIARERGDRSAMTLALMGLGNVAADDGDDAGALRAYEECLRIWTELGQKAGMAGAHNNIGLVFMYAGDAQKAVYHLEKSAQIYREIGDIERIAITSDSLGRAYLRAGDLSQAEVYVREGLALNLEVGDSWNIAYGLISLAEIVCADKNYIFAARLLAAADAAYDDLSDRLSDHDRVTRSQCLEAARDALGDEIFKATWSESLSLTPEEVLANGVDTSAPIASGSVFSSPPRKRAAGDARERDIADLSPREGEVLVLLAQRLSNAEIAEQLHLSLYTVNAHLRNIYSKLNLSSRADARRYAAAMGLI